MSIWRPRQHIRMIAIGLNWRGSALLAAEVRDDSERVKGVRPLGGGVDFGETWDQALIREFREELNIDVTITGEPFVLENIYVHEGQTGHEIVFAADVDFPDGAFDSQDTINFTEGNGLECTAKWFELAQLDQGDLELYPTQLKARLIERSN